MLYKHTFEWSTTYPHVISVLAWDFLFRYLFSNMTTTPLKRKSWNPAKLYLFPDSFSAQFDVQWQGKDLRTLKTTELFSSVRMHDQHSVAESGGVRKTNMHIRPKSKPNKLQVNGISSVTPAVTDTQSFLVNNADNFVMATYNVLLFESFTRGANKLRFHWAHFTFEIWPGFQVEDRSIWWANNVKLVLIQD